MSRLLPILALAAAFPVSASLLGCSGGGEPTTPQGDANGPRDTLVVAWPSDLNSLNAVVSSSASDGEVIDMLNMPVIDSDFDCSIKKLPGIATSWSWSEDGKVLSMTLRDDIKWSDGQPVTTDDFQFTYDLIADPAVASPRQEYVTRMEPDGHPKVVDPTHIEWHFTEAYDRDTQTAHASMNLLPKHVLEGVDKSTLRGNDFSRNPLVNGPWKIAKYEPKQRIVLEPNDAFTGPADMKPKLERVILKILPEYNTRLLQLQTGEVDMMEQIRVPDADMLRKEHPNVTLYRRGYRSEDHVVWNLKNPIFADVRVREALAEAVDVDAMIKKLLTSETGEAYARRAIGTITPELCGVHNDDVQPLAYDVAKAKQLLADAGWTDSNGDGIVDKDGKNLEFSLMTNAENSRRSDAAIYLQSYWKEIGVSANIEKVEFNSMTDRLRQRDFDAVLGGWSAGLFVDPSDMWHSDEPGHQREFNYGSYSNPDVDALIEKGLKTPKPEEAAPIWKDMQAKIYADQPYLFLWWMDEIVGVDSRFQNVHINVLSNYYHLYDWEVPADKVKYTH